MKINGPNHSNFNPYQKQLNKFQEMKQLASQTDRLEISKEAKEMQGMDKQDPARQKRLDEIKQAVDAGTYKVDHQETAQKMIDFYTK